MSEPESVAYFDMNQLMPGATIVIVGKKCTGKTSMVMAILEHMSRWFHRPATGETGFDAGRVITPTEPSIEKFSKCVPRCFIVPPSVEVLDEFITTVKTEYKRDSRRGREPRNTFLVCDDTAFDVKFMRSKTLSEVFMNGRNFNNTTILVLQYLMKIGPDLRSNADFVFVFYDNNTTNLKNIYNFWFSHMPKAVFKKVFDECTKDHGVLVVDVRRAATSRDWHDCVFWYRARETKDIPPFRLCVPDMYRLESFCVPSEPEEDVEPHMPRDGVLRLGPDGSAFSIAALAT